MLSRLMRYYAFRKAIGANGRWLAWCHLGANISEGVYIGPRVTMRFPGQVTIGSGTILIGRIWFDSWGTITIGRNVILSDHIDLLTASHHVDSPVLEGDVRPITIGDQAWLPLHVIVLPGVSIGSHAVIGTGSVVTRDVPDYGVAAGNPARVVKSRARIKYTYVPTSL